MSRPLSPRAPTIGAVLAVFLIGCGRADLRNDLPAYQPGPHSSVTVTVTGCTAPPPNPTQVRVVVDPWVAYVDSGSNFQWVARGDMNHMRVRHRAGTGTWPFASGEFPPAGTGHPPGQPLNAGPADRAPKGARSQYDLIIQCGSLRLTIDPDIVIREW